MGDNSGMGRGPVVHAKPSKQAIGKYPAFRMD